MFFEKIFETEVEAIAEITKNNVEACASALRTRFEEAIDGGITDLNLAAEKAMVLHAHLDHGAGLEIPEDFPFTLDAEAETHIINQLMEINDDGRAEERVELTVPIFRRYREWGVNIPFAGTAAINQAQIQWENDNPPPDLDEDKFFGMLENEALVDSVRELILKVYRDERERGKNVRTTAISAVTAARLAAQLADLLKGGNGSNLNKLIGKL